MKTFEMELGIEARDLLRMQPRAKVGVAFALAVTILGLYGYFFLWDQYERLEILKHRILQQEEQIALKQNMLKHLPKLRAEMKLLQERESRAIAALPSRKEIPALLTDISLIGHEEGLEFLRFAPQPETMWNFYAEAPVSLKVRGNYHSIIRFLDRIANMPRIVNVSHLVLSLDVSSGETTTLTVIARATTYRFLEHKNNAQGDHGK